MMLQLSDDYHGQLGDGGELLQSTPVQVQGLANSARALFHLYVFVPRILGLATF